MQQHNLSIQSVEHYWSSTNSSINPGNTVMGCAHATGFAPEAVSVSPIITGDRWSSLYGGNINQLDKSALTCLIG